MTVKAIVKRFCDQHDCYSNCPFAHEVYCEWEDNYYRDIKCPFDEEDGIKALEQIIDDWRLNIPFKDPPTEED